MRKFSKFSHLGLRLITALVVLASVITLLAAVYDVRVSKGEVKTQISKRTETLANVLSHVAATPIQKQNTKSLSTLSHSTLVSDSSLLYVKFVDTNGELLLEETAGEHSPEDIFIEIERDVLTESEQTVGKVIVGVSHQPYDEAVRAILLSTVGRGLLFMLVISICMMYITRKFIMQPINELDRMALQFGEGDLESPIHLHTGDELAFLAETIDETRQKLIRGQREIMKKNIELKQTHDKVLEADKRKSVFISRMSHEIRTSMNGILGMLNLLECTNLNQEQQDYFNVLTNSSSNLMDIINDVVDFAKMESGQLQVEKVAFNLHQNAKDSFKNMAVGAEAKSLKYILEIDPNVPKLAKGDPERIQQMLGNYLSNAIKYTPQGRVQCSVTLDSKSHHHAYVKYSVSDTGVGIPRAQRSKLFKSFSQVDDINARRNLGTGLGLAICKQLAHLMGGDVGFSSEEGNGATFWFTVKLQRLDHTPEQLPKFDNLRTARNVLIISNRPEAQEINKYLDNWGLQVSEIGSKLLAEDEMEHEVSDDDHFSMLVYDMDEPLDDSLSYIKKIRTIPVYKEVPILIIGDKSMHQGTLRVGEIRDCYYLSRPYDVIYLYDRADKVLRVQEQKNRMTSANGTINKNRPLLILVAEDNEVNQQVVERMLKKLGHETLIVPNGVEAVNAVKRNSFDMILMDCEMPGMNGYEASRVIRGIEEKGNLYLPPGVDRLPIIAFTADVIETEMKKAKQFGMDDMLDKPVSSQKLKATISKYYPCHTIAFTATESEHNIAIES